MSDFAKRIANRLAGNDFDEIPVSAKEFITSPEYLGLVNGLSDYQYQLVDAMTQVYKLSTLISLYGEEAGRARWNQTCKEIVMQLGKGNFPIYQKFYSTSHGYVDSTELQQGWTADSRDEPRAAYPFFDQGEDDIYRVTTERGYTFLSGPNHRTPAWDSPNQSGPGQMVETINILDKFVELKRGWSEPETPLDIEPREAFALGALIGKPIVNTDIVYIGSKSATRRIDLYDELLSFGLDAKEGHILFKAKNPVKSRTGVWFEGLDELVARFGYEWDDSFLSMSNECAWQFIRGMMYSTGRFQVVDKSTITRTYFKFEHIAMVTSKRELASGLHLMLLKLGVISKLHTGFEKQPGYYVQINRKEEADIFLDGIKFLPVFEGAHERYAKVVTKSTKLAPKYERVVSVEKVGREAKTVCTTVAVEEVLNAGGIITSNSGKDFTSTVAVAYVVYLLMCLRDPAVYYDKAPGDSIDIINIAINADQAQRVFFENFMNKIKRCPWFDGKYDPKQGSVKFDKNINVYSGHSEREAFEGYNTLMVILDEIAGFAEAPEDGIGEELSKTSKAIYKMYRGSVTSRFPDFGKLVLLSFPRREGDFIQKKYDELIAEKHVVRRKELLKRDPELPDGTEGNEMTLEWDEDHITRYRRPRVFALKRPSWEVNPSRKLQDYADDFFDDLGDALGRFACCVEGTLIPTNKGVIPIENVMVGDLVASSKGKARVTAAWSQKKEAIRITFKNGQFIECTEDHGIKKVDRIRQGEPAYRLGKYKSSWVEAGSLSIGDKVMGHYDSSGLYGNNELTPDEAYILGLMVSDGWLRNDDRVYCGITCGLSEEYADRVLEVFNRAFGGARKTLSYRKKMSVKKQWAVECGKRRVVERLQELGITSRTHASEKRIPSVVFGSPRESIESFITGYLDGDGSCSPNKTTFVSTSKAMLEELQVLLSMVGCRSNLSINTRARSNGKVLSKFDLWGLRLNKYDTKILATFVSPLSHKNPTVTDFTIGKDQPMLANEIISIENIGERTVYDLTTTTSEFIANGLVVHNCSPSNVSRGFFKRMDRAEESFAFINGVDGDGIFHPTFLPQEDKKYFVHVDLAQKHDRCAVSMAHVDRWIKFDIPGSENTEYLPFIKVDAIRWWTPSKTETVDFANVVEYIKSLRRRGFDIGMCTFDRWNSHSTMQELEMNGIPTSLLSVAKKHYDDWLVNMYDGRLEGPNEPILLKEMSELVEKNGKVDHPRKGSKDLADAVCGSIYNAVVHTLPESTVDADVITLDDFKRDRAGVFTRPGVTVVPKVSAKEAPDDIQEMLRYMRLL